MSKQKSWAENEIELACKRENPNWDGKSFDYGCSCYQSALKAYKSLESDGHSGFSWSVTRNILIRLMDDLPLTAITDEDFYLYNNKSFESEEYLRKRGLKSHLQCPRMSSLFREETLDGKITYSDNDRYYCVDKNGHTYQGGGACSLIDKLFPITMPYYPKVDKYVAYTDDFLLDPKNGDYDHKAILYLITPEGEKIELDEYYKEINGKMEKISKEQYFEERKLCKEEN